jgi:uncharacterized protein YjaG (DUF416 family)
MGKINPKSVDDYEVALLERLAPWTPSQRTALAAAMADRWFPVYELFSRNEKWGDAALVRRCVDAVWNHAAGKPLANSDGSRLKKQLQDVTPHMDDFDAPDALAVCIMVGDAVDCCGSSDNLTATVRVALCGFEAVIPDWAFEPEEQPRLWKRVAARKELKSQVRLIEWIEANQPFDARTVEALKRECTKPEYRGERSPEEPAGTKPAGVSNQQLFEQYRRMMEADLKSPGELDLPGVGYAFLRMAAWMGRYSRRRQTIDGSYGKPADTIAQRGLVRRQHALESAVAERPDWDHETNETIEMCMASPTGTFDVRSPMAPHGYGPSLRRLWIRAKRAGRSDVEAWGDIVAWARHRPEAWLIEDRRKKKGLAQTTPELGVSLARTVEWKSSNNAECPWTTSVEGQQWSVRLNDFPDDYMYSLVIDGADVGSFHDWPETWSRPES